MAEKNDIFEGYESPGLLLGDDFDDAVFRKIGIRKRRRKVAVTSLGAFLLGGFLFFTGNSLFKTGPDKVGVAYNSNGEKREVMLTDDVVLATFDGQNSYLVDTAGSSDDISI